MTYVTFKKNIFIAFLILLMACPLCMAEIEKNNNKEKQLFEKGVSLLHQGNYSESVNEFTKLIAINPDLAAVYKNRGAAYMKLGLYPLAISDFEKNLTLDGEAIGLHSNLGVAYFYQGEYKKAIGHYNQEIKQYSNSYFAYFNRSICWSKLGNLDQSLADVQAALTIKPDIYQAICFKGDVLWDMGNLPKAREVYQEAINLYPDQSYAREKLAKLGKTDTKSKKKVSSNKNITKKLPPNSPGKISKINKKNNEIPKQSIEIYELQTGACGERENADKICETLSYLGYKSRIITKKMPNGEILYTIRTGKFISYQDAKKSMERFKAKTGMEALIEKYKLR